MTTSDNIKIAAWFVPSSAKASAGEPSEQKSDKVIIILHGYPFDKANLLGWASFLHDDFNLFFFEEGSHGGVPESLEKEYQKRVLEFFNQNL